MNFVTHLVAAEVGMAFGVFALALCYVGRSVETCVNASGHVGEFVCSKCGATWRTEDLDLVEPTLWTNGVADYPSYCQKCGRRIVGE